MRTGSGASGRGSGPRGCKVRAAGIACRDGNRPRIGFQRRRQLRLVDARESDHERPSKVFRPGNRTTGRIPRRSDRNACPPPDGARMSLEDGFSELPSPDGPRPAQGFGPSRVATRRRKPLERDGNRTLLYQYGADPTRVGRTGGLGNENRGARRNQQVVAGQREGREPKPAGRRARDCRFEKIPR
jgi:hypothetical protein